MTNGGHSATATFSEAVVSSSILEGNAAEAIDNIVNARTNPGIKIEGFPEKNLRSSLSYDDGVMDGHKFTHLPMACLIGLLSRWQPGVLG